MSSMPTLVLLVPDVLGVFCCLLCYSQQEENVAMAHRADLMMCLWVDGSPGPWCCGKLLPCLVTCAAQLQLL